MLDKLHKIITPVLTFGYFGLFSWMILQPTKYPLEYVHYAFILSVVMATAWGGGKAAENVIEKYTK